MPEKFIQINTPLNGNVTIAVSQISSVKPSIGGTVIVLKEIKDGNNVEISTSAAYGNVINIINNA